MTDLNDYIKKSHIKAAAKFNEELEAWMKETGENPATLYEDANTTFTLSDIMVVDGYLRFWYDGCPDKERVVFKDEETGKYYEDEYDGIMDFIKFWRACLRRAKRYWAMDSEKLDRIQDGEEEDDDDDQEE